MMHSANEIGNLWGFGMSRVHRVISQPKRRISLIVEAVVSKPHTLSRVAAPMSYPVAPMIRHIYLPCNSLILVCRREQLAHSWGISTVPRQSGHRQICSCKVSILSRSNTVILSLSFFYLYLYLYFPLPLPLPLRLQSSHIVSNVSHCLT